MPTYESELLTAARAVARLQTQRRRLKKQLKQIAVELRHEKKILRALAEKVDARRPDVFPSRVFGDGVGLVAKTGTELRLSLDADALARPLAEQLIAENE